MKWIFKLVIVAALLWSGYWYIGAEAQKKLYTELVQDGRARGWTLDSQNLEVVGFPNRFDTSMTDLEFFDPSGLWGWQGAEFQIKALSYQPNHIIMAWPGVQRLQTPAGALSLNAALLRASLVLNPASTLPLDRLQIEGRDIDLKGAQGWAASVATLGAALFKHEIAIRQYRFGVEMTNITAPAARLSALNRGANLPEQIERLNISAQLEFDREIDRASFASGVIPRPISAIIAPSVMVWGESKLTVEGDLAATPNGYIEGQLNFEVSGWQALFDVFNQVTNLRPSEAEAVQRALEGASADGRLVFTVNFDNGSTRIGPFTIGPAPAYPF